MTLAVGILVVIGSVADWKGPVFIVSRIELISAEPIKLQTIWALTITLATLSVVVTYRFRAFVVGVLSLFDAHAAHVERIIKEREAEEANFLLSGLPRDDRSEFGISRESLN